MSCDLVNKGMSEVDCERGNRNPICRGCELTDLKRRVETKEREIVNLLNVVCSAPACTAAIIRHDDGSRKCAAGHSARWVNIDFLTKTEKELAKAKEDGIHAVQAEREAIIHLCLEILGLQEPEIISAIRDRGVTPTCEFCIRGIPPQISKEPKLCDWCASATHDSAACPDRAPRKETL